MDSTGVWVSVLEPTEQQEKEWLTASPERQEELSSSLLRPASEAEAALGQAICEKHMPEGAVRLTCDIFMPGEHGLINCRVGGEHKQIRF